MIFRKNIRFGGFIRPLVSYLISSNRLLFKNIAHDGSFQHCTWLYLACGAKKEKTLSIQFIPTQLWSKTVFNEMYLLLPSSPATDTITLKLFHKRKPDYIVK